jgi:hypothetical protein
MLGPSRCEDDAIIESRVGAIRDGATSIDAAAFSDSGMGANLAARGNVLNVRELQNFRFLGVEPMMDRGFTVSVVDISGTSFELLE